MNVPKAHLKISLPVAAMHCLVVAGLSSTSLLAAPENVATQASIVSATGVVGDKPPAMVIDGISGDTNNRWSTDGMPQTLVIDLGAKYDLTRFEVFPYFGRAYRYTFEGSLDNISYTSLVNRSLNTTGGAVIADDIPAAVARYVRFKVTGAASSYSGTWVSIQEFKCFGTPSLEPTNDGPQIIDADLLVTGGLRVDAGLDLVTQGLSIFSTETLYSNGTAPSITLGYDLNGNPNFSLFNTDPSMATSKGITFDPANAIANFQNLNLSITGSLSLNGSPALTMSSASDLYPSISALPNYGISGINFDRSSGSAAFGSKSYSLGINNFSGGASRIGRDNGQSYPGSGTTSNSTNPIPFANFRNNAAFGVSVIGHGFSSWSDSSFKGTERLENNFTTGTSLLSVSAGAQIFNTTATGGSSLTIEPSFYSTSPTTGVSLFGNAYASIYGNGRMSNTTLSGSSRLHVWHATSNSGGSNVASVDNSIILGGSSVSMSNQYSSSAPNSDYVTLSGKSRLLARSNRSTTYSSALGESMIYSGDFSFSDQGAGPGSYFPGDRRWDSVFPRMATTHAFAAGESIVANGTHGTALGKARVYSDYGTAIGEGVDAGTAGVTVVGRYNILQQYTFQANEEASMQQFVVGNGVGDLDSQRSNALVIERSGRSTFTNKSWIDDPSVTPTPENSYAQAFVAEGHTLLKGDTRLDGKIVISNPQGDISMGNYQ